MGRRPKVSREGVLAAARAAFGARGFDGTTLADIAARVGVSPAALLRHAATKAELFAAAMVPEPGAIRPPLEFLAEVSGDEDPQLVIRRIAEVMVPFLEEKLGETVALWMRSKANAAEAANSLSQDPSLFPLPFDPRLSPNPPQRALALIEGWLRRAVRAKRISVREPRAAALLLLGSLHSYVTLHRIVHICDPAYPFERYVQALVEIWTHGAIVPSASASDPNAASPKSQKRTRAARPAKESR